MFIYNIKYQDFPIAIHAPGFKVGKWSPRIDDPKERVSSEANPLWNAIVKRWETFQYEQKDYNQISKSLTVFTFNNTPSEGILEISLNRLGIPYTILGKNINSWKNIHKIKLLNDALDEIDTEYTLVLDCFDVIVIRHLSAVIGMFQQHDCKMLFNCEAVFFPDFGENFITTSFKEKERFLSNSIRPYLNSGMYIAETAFLRNLMAEMIDFDFFDYYNPSLLPDKNSYYQHQKSFHSDQLLYHHMYIKYFPQIRLDHHMHLFFNSIRSRRFPFPLVTLTSSSFLNLLIKRRYAWTGMRPHN